MPKNIKIDPRKGIVTLGSSKNPRPTLNPPASKKKDSSDSMSAVELASLIKLLTEDLKQALAEGLQEVSSQKQAPVYISAPEGSLPAAHQEINIDESIIDVGIGDLGELKKGTVSSNIDKSEEKIDKGISKSMDKLRRLKK